ncbi:MAG: BrnT family toxin [Anaerolineae bacterium]
MADKLAQKHNVSAEEVEQILAGQPRFKFMEQGRFQGEDVYAALGRTQEGRYLLVIFIHKKTGEALILSAREMDKKERRKYGRK